MLRVARALGRRPDIDVVTSFLGLHAVPPAEEIGRAAYVAAASGPMLDAVVGEGLADAVDAFCEGIAFSPEEVRHFFEAARARGLPCGCMPTSSPTVGAPGSRPAWVRCPRIISSIRARRACRPWPRPAPSRFFFRAPSMCWASGKSRRSPALRAAGVPMAVATDANPGSSPLLSPLLAQNMACVLFGLTPEEALRGMTVNAARALGLEDRGTLEVGKLADLAVWRIGRPAELAYWIGCSPLELLVKAGRVTSPPATGARWRS